MKQNSIAIKYPIVAKDWDKKKNPGLSPEYVTATDKRKVWWNCEKGHIYQVSIHSRIRSGGCKICLKPEKAESFRNKLLQKSTSFAEEYPYLAKQWDNAKNKIKPTEVSKKSNVKVWFKCEKGHEFESTPKRRVASTGCPICVQQSQGDRIMRWKLKKAGVSFAEKNPELLDEWDYSKNTLDPFKLTPHSNKKVSWKCKFGHEWKASIYNRTGNNSGCPKCRSMTSKLEVFVLCELRQFFKNVEWRGKIEGYECDILIGDINVGIEVDGAYWHDEKLQRDRDKLRVFKENGIDLIRIRAKELPEIEGRVILYDKKDKMASLVSKLLKYIEELHSNFSFKDYYKNQKQIGVKEYKKILSLLPSPTESDSLKMLNPQLSKEWHPVNNEPLTPEMFSPNSEMKVWWLCDKNHEWQASIKNRHKRNSGCPFCYEKNRAEIVRKGRLKITGKTLQSEHPELTVFWDSKKNELTPEDVAPKAKMVVWWKCTYGHEWQERIYIVADRKNKCQQCRKERGSAS